MRRLATTALALIGMAGFVACGLELSGESKIALPERDDGGSTDATAVGDLPPGTGTDINSGGETPIPDGGEEAGSCGASSIVTNFAAGGISPEWIKYGNTKGIVANSNGLVEMVATGVDDVASGLFYLPKVSATSFTATFFYYAQTPSVGLFDYPRYADGLTFTWLTEVADPPGLGKNAEVAVAGGGLGLPSATKGFGFALDAYRNAPAEDLDGPSFYVFGLDGTRGKPGSYPWHLHRNGPWNGVYDAWRKVTITLAGGKLSANVSDSKIFEDVSVPTAKITAIGFTAATGGGDSLGIYVDTVDIKLTDATCP